MDDWGALENYLDADHCLTQLPSGKGRRRYRELALLYLISKFEYKRDYSEGEVNALIMQWHTFSDPVTLRRELFNAKLLGRKRDGSHYWRIQYDID